MATATEVLQMILRAKDEASGVFSKLGGSIIVFNQALEIASKLFGAVESAIRPVIDLLIESAKAADESALAESKLAASLRSTGQFSQGYVESLKQIAAQFQTLTGLSDEVILDAERQLIAFGATREQIVPLTRTVLDLSAGLGTDLASATLLVSKALQGQTEVLGRYGIQVTDGASKAQKLAEIQEQVNQKFGGQAVARMATMGGQISLLKERYNDLQEAIGGAITNSEAFQALLDQVSTLILEATGFVTENKDVMKAWVKEGILIAIDGLGLLVDASVITVQALSAVSFGTEKVIRAFRGFATAMEQIKSGDFSAVFKNTDQILGQQVDHFAGFVDKIKGLGSTLKSRIGEIRDGIASATVDTAGAGQLQAAKNLQEINNDLVKQGSALDGLRGKAASILAVNNQIAEQRELFRTGAISLQQYTLNMSQLISQQSSLAPATFNLSTGFKELRDKINDIFKSGVAPSTDVIKQLVEESTNAQRTLRQEFGADIPEAMKKSSDEVKNLIQQLAQEGNIKLDDILKDVPPILQKAKEESKNLSGGLAEAAGSASGLNVQLQQALTLIQTINAQGGLQVVQ
jgi:gas vesicle protein